MGLFGGGGPSFGGSGGGIFGSEFRVGDLLGEGGGGGIFGGALNEAITGAGFGAPEFGGGGVTFRLDPNVSEEVRIELEREIAAERASEPPLEGSGEDVNPPSGVSPGLSLPPVIFLPPSPGGGDVFGAPPIIFEPPLPPVPPQAPPPTEDPRERERRPSEEEADAPPPPCVPLPLLFQLGINPTINFVQRLSLLLRLPVQEILRFVGVPQPFGVGQPIGLGEFPSAAEDAASIPGCGPLFFQPERQCCRVCVPKACCCGGGCGCGGCC